MHNDLEISFLIFPSSCFDLSANDVEDVLCRRYACLAYQILSLVFAEYCFPKIVMQPHLATIDTLHTMRRLCRVQRFVCDKCITTTHCAIHKWHIEWEHFYLAHFFNCRLHFVPSFTSKNLAGITPCAYLRSYDEYILVI